MDTLEDYMDIIDNHTMTLREARNEEATDLYVLNTCDLKGRVQKGDLHLKITVNGRLTKVKVPDTFVPWDLTKYTSKENWLKDPDFVKLVEKRVVTIIESKFAEMILATEDAKQEHEKLLAREHDLEYGFQNVEAENARMIEDNANREKVQDVAGRNKQVKEINTKVKAQSIGTYQAPVKLVAIFSAKLDESARLAALRNMKSELSINDFNYIMNVVPSKDTKIKEWVVAQQQRKRAAA